MSNTLPERRKLLKRHCCGVNVRPRTPNQASSKHHHAIKFATRQDTGCCSLPLVFQTPLKLPDVGLCCITGLKLSNTAATEIILCISIVWMLGKRGQGAN